MRPAPEQIITPQSLLQASASWVAAAVAGQLRGSALALRAGVQAVQRASGGGAAGVARAVADLHADVDRLDDHLASLLQPKHASGSRLRLLPEREVAAAVSLLAHTGASLRSAIDPRAPLVTGRPGMIGVATLHLLLASSDDSPRGLQAIRHRPDGLRVEILAGKPDRSAGSGSLHAVVVSAVVEALGGHAFLQADTGPCFEVPLEL